MSVDVVEDPVQMRIVRYLTDAFITERAIDPAAVAQDLIHSGLNLPAEDLKSRVRAIANGIGVRMK